MSMTIEDPWRCVKIPLVSANADMVDAVVGRLKDRWHEYYTIDREADGTPVLVYMGDVERLTWIIESNHVLDDAAERALLNKIEGEIQRQNNYREC